MKEIKIILNMNQDGDINVKNQDSGYEFCVSFSLKEIKATDLYELLSFELGNQYVVESNIEEVDDVKKKYIFNEVISMIEGVVEKIKDISIEPPERIIDEVEDCQ